MLSLLLVSLAACGTVKDVRLQHLETGKVVVCEGKSGLPTDALAPAVLEQRGCIEDFKVQGYQRIE